MKKVLKILLFFTFSLLLLQCNNNSSKNIVGQWKGLLKTPHGTINIIFNIKEQNKKLIATLDSPDQGVVNIKTESIEIKKDMLLIKIPKIEATYQGKIIDDTTIIGTLTQKTTVTALDLKKEDINTPTVNDELFEENDFFYSDTITFINKSANVRLAGTITIPKNKDKCAAVLLVTGTGPQNRDEEMLGHKPFKRIANYLSKQGIAVLRYDDRGFAKSTGNHEIATTSDFLSDALSGISYLKSHQLIDSNKIGIIGHSEGGYIAIMAAAQNKNPIKFIISLAPPLITGEQLLLLQSEKILRIQGANDELIKKTKSLNSAIYAILKKQANNKKAKLDIMATIKHYALNDEMKKDVNAELMANTVITPWFRYFLTINAQNYLPYIKCPSLLLFAEKDVQVPAIENENEFTSFMKNKTITNFTLTTIKGVNHLFQGATTGLPSEYYNKDNPTMNDETLEVIYTWMKNNVL